MKQLIKFLLSWIVSKKTSVSKPVDYTDYLGKLFSLFPRMSETQKEGVIFVTSMTSHLPLKQQAYLLATTYHETAHTMQPITEYGGVKYFDKYDTGRLAIALGNSPEKDGDGYKYRGRGYVMITGLANYKRATKELGVDFVNHPDYANQPQHAIKTLIKGCTEGWFGNRKRLDYYISDASTDYVNARRVVNGVDDANLIAGYAKTFEQALGFIK